MKARLIFTIAIFVLALALVGAQGDNQALINQLIVYQGETQHGTAHVERWTRALAALGHGSHNNPMTAAEAQTYVDRGWNRWIPVRDALQPPEPAQDPPPSTNGDNPWDTDYGPSWVDGTNCFWWVDSETVRVREFSTFDDWKEFTDNGGTPPAWNSAYGYYVASSRAPMPQVVEFQIGSDSTYRVSRFLPGGNAGSIMEHLNAYGGSSSIYPSDTAACAVASRFFTPQGNFR